MGYGAYLGVLFSRKFFGPMEPLMLKSGLLSILLRFLILGALCIPFGILFVLIKWTANLTVIFLFKTTIPILGITFMLFGFANFFFVKWNLIRQSGQSKVETQDNHYHQQN